MRTISRRGVLAASAALGACASAGVQAPAAPTGPDAEAAALLAARIDVQRRGTGGALAIVRDRRLSFAAHGTDRLENGAPLTADTPFQIASITKIFTAFLLADAVARGEVALEDAFTPALNYEGRAITLLDLATHTSGLPLRPPSRADRSQDNPYAGYSEADLVADLTAARLTRAPGERFEYSNFGYALLGWALSQRTGRSYEQLLADRILRPLGMRDTTLTPSAAMRARMVQGYDTEFAPMQAWDFGALAPAGGLYSTLSDLPKFLGLWTGDHGRMSVAARSMLSPSRPGADEETHMALGWRVRTRNGKSIAWSNGSGGGVRSFMAFGLADHAGVIAFANMSTGVGVDDIGMHVLDPSEPVDVAPIPVRPAIHVAPALLDQYAGTYTHTPDDTVTIIRTEGGLAIQQGAQQINLFAETERLFFIREVNVTLEFAAPEGGRSPSFVLTQARETVTFRRQ
jgi:CubicO group peptidase (beta-lactamase class C family)